MRLIDADDLTADISSMRVYVGGKDITDLEYKDSILTAICEAPTFNVPKWISVDEQLPEEDVRVLVWLREEKGEYTRIDTDRRYNGKWVRWQPRVTHWMPLPEPPTVELEVTKCENN